MREPIEESCWSQAPDAMFATDRATGLLVDVNSAVEHLTGFTRQELVGQHQSVLFLESERAAIEAAFQNGGMKIGVAERFHFLTKNKLCVPVSISSSSPFEFGGRLLVVGTSRNISELAEKERRLAAEHKALSAYAAAALAMGRTRSAEGLIQTVCEAIVQEPSYLLAWIGFAEGGLAKPVRIAGMAGAARAFLDGIPLSWSADLPGGLGPTGVAIRTETIQVQGDGEAAGFYSPWQKRGLQLGIHSMVLIPFRLQDGRRAVLSIYSSEPEAFEAGVIEQFSHLTQEIRQSLQALEEENRKPRRSTSGDEFGPTDGQSGGETLTEVLTAMVTAMSTAMEMREPHTAGHQSRVAEIACVIAKEMGWTEDSIEELRLAAKVQDIGMIAIPTEILTKPGRLTDAEMELIRQHPDTGFNILKGIPFAMRIAEVVRQHHERMDGSGYPRGLRGDEILPGARILAVGDIVDAMASSRPHRPALGLDVALEEIQKQAGIQLDAEVVRTCVALIG
jgi:PAS domain S-box-containing protein